MGDDGGEAIPFIVFDGDDDFVVSENAREFLSKVEAPIQVISVAGMYRTGKSFLLNHILLQRNKGFEVGPTVEACTKGLWIWNRVIERPRKGGGVARMIVIDTEGIGSTQASEKHDATIFSLSLLLSSYFIYNSVGCIDERALNSLSLVANLTEHIHVSSKAKHETGADFSMHFPSFLWLVRDFALQLISPEGKPISAKEYLELALKETPGFNEQIESKNRIRRMLVSFFTTRDCHTLVRPITDEEGLQRLSTTPSDQLRPEFTEQVAVLQNRVYASAPIKCVGKITVDGRGLCDLADAYLTSINGGAVPAIKDAYSQVCEGRLVRAVGQAIQLFEGGVEALSKSAEAGKGGEQEVLRVLREIKSRAMQLFEKDAVDGDVAKHRLILDERLADLESRTVSEHKSRAKKWAEEVLEKAYSPIVDRVFEGHYETFGEYEASRKKIRLECMEQGVPAESISLFMEGRISDVAMKMDLKSREAALEAHVRAEAAAMSAQNEWDAARRVLEVEVMKLEERLKQAEARAGELEGRERRAREDGEREAESLRKALHEVEEKRRESERESDKRKVEVMSLEREKEREREERERESKRMAKREADLEKLLEEAKGGAEEMKKEREMLRGEREREREKGERALAEARDRMDVLEKRLGAAQDSLHTAELTIERLQIAEGKQRGEDDEVVAGLRNELARLKNAHTVACEEASRLERQLEAVRKELKDESDMHEKARARLDEAQRQQVEAVERCCDLAAKVEEAQRSLARISEEKDAAERTQEAFLAEREERLETMRGERDAALASVDMTRAQVESRVATLEAEREVLRGEAAAAVAELERAREAQEAGMNVTDREWTDKVRELESSHRRQLSELRAMHQKGQEDAAENLAHERSMNEAHVLGLHSRLADLQDEHDAELAKSAEQIRDYENAIDELERDNNALMAKIRREGEQLLQQAETTFVRAEADLNRELGVARSRAEGLAQQLAELREVYREDKKEAATRHEAQVAALEGEVRSMRELVAVEKKAREEALLRQDKDSLSGAASDAVSGLSRVLTQKATELEAFKISSEETMSQLNRLIETKDVENESLRRYWKIFVLHCLQVQCRYCGRDVLTVHAEEHVTRCMQHRGIAGWHQLTTPPPGLELRVEVAGSQMQNVDGKSRRVYVLTVTGGGASWEVSRRFSDFTGFHKLLKARLPKVKLPDVSQMHANTLSVFQNEAQSIDKRRQQISDFFQQVLKISAVCESEELRAFLELAD